MKVNRKTKLSKLNSELFDGEKLNSAHQQHIKGGQRIPLTCRLIEVTDSHDGIDPRLECIQNGDSC
ncbi:grasp-with-spasm system A modified peptide [Microscilla marina]|uniref:Uncharacterized protein n=1 Tax=Microscilla marina ATCC 23134 TaxID=313606 RepID=A1ZL49_MICM2|nr:grasp-with-spasm system A modified peptide [Microscilla marina]EAY29015.1 hypothetical protein M23134_00169 [Microscilla marina ATCC 23134]